MCSYCFFVFFPLPLPLVFAKASGTLCGQQLLSQNKYWGWSNWKRHDKIKNNILPPCQCAGVKVTQQQAKAFFTSHHFLLQNKTKKISEDAGVTNALKWKNGRNMLCGKCTKFFQLCATQWIRIIKRATQIILVSLLHPPLLFLAALHALLILFRTPHCLFNHHTDVAQRATGCNKRYNLSSAVNSATLPLLVTSAGTPSGRVKATWLAEN